MKSIRDIYKIGKGPSSSHTMGPEKRRQRCSNPSIPRPTALWRRLYGSLSLDRGAATAPTGCCWTPSRPFPREIVWVQRRSAAPPPPQHAWSWSAFRGGERTGFMRVMSIGGGDIRYRGAAPSWKPPRSTGKSPFAEIADYCKTHNLRISDYVEQREGPEHLGLSLRGLARHVRGHSRRA